MDDITLGLSEL